ncbi:MAG: hypothetical protein RL215_1257, partial [Planctomycetota bacterium]
MDEFEEFTGSNDLDRKLSADPRLLPVFPGKTFHAIPRTTVDSCQSIGGNSAPATNTVCSRSTFGGFPMRRLAGSFFSLGLGFSALCGTGYAGDTAQPRQPDAVVIQAAKDARFALALRSPAAPVTLTHHIILVDTSASQTGVYRLRTLQTVRDLLAALPADHHIQLLTADSRVQALTTGFVAARSPEATNALSLLSKVTPIGATDLAAALSDAINSTTQPVSIAYIGDGMSTGDLLNGNDLAGTVANLHSRQASFHAMLLGPRMDAHLAGVLANLTGGSFNQLAADSITAQVNAFAQLLQQAPVLVSDLKLSADQASLSVPQTIALRSDRHTLVFGEGSISGNCQITGTIAGRPQTWTVTPQAVRDGGAEIATLARKSAATGGLNSPYIGLEGLSQAATDLGSIVSQSIETARQLHSEGRSEQALQLIAQAQQLDAGNTVLTSLAASIQEGAAQPADRLGPPAVDEGDALSRTEVRNQIITQQMVQSVNAALDEAKRVAPEQPDYSIGLLKDALEAVRSKKEIAPEVRLELDRRIVAGLAGIEARRQANEIRQQQLSES